MSPAAHHSCAHSIACFISPHGFGHAARAAGVIEAIHQISPACCFEIFTSVPSWFFEDSLSAPFAYHRIQTDLGLIQKSPFQEDIHETLRRLDTFLPFDPERVDALSQTVSRRKCELIICDIAPLGLAVGRRTGIPSVLIENFTWDWIYQGYPAVAESMEKHVQYLQRVFRSADYHIQAEPVCRKLPVDLTVSPVSRKCRTHPAEIRKQLRLPGGKKVVLITTGGIPDQYGFLSQLADRSDISFVLPGASRSVEFSDNLILLPHRSGFFHPVLVNACDAVVGKVGYSTLAEVYAAGVPFGHVSRPDFREARKLAVFIHQEMNGLAIGEVQFYDGSWLSQLPQLLKLSRQQRRAPNGSDQIADFICQVGELQTNENYTDQ